MRSHTGKPIGSLNDAGISLGLSGSEGRPMRKYWAHAIATGVSASTVKATR